MSDFDVTQEEVSAAATFLRSYLTTKIPTADFSENSAISDLVIDGHAYVYAYLKKQADAILARQSVLTLKNLGDTQSTTDAADALLANLFIGRDQGKFSRGVATLHFSQRVDALILRTTRFFRTRSLVYYIDSAVDFLVNASAMRPNIDATGNIIDWIATVYVVAARTGAEFNQKAGKFVAIDRFSPFVLYAEHVSDLVGGDSVQTNADFIAQANNAMSIRALINSRSNDALLRETFSSIEKVVSIGYGDAEMTRDLITENSGGVTFHVGGMTDIYVRTRTAETIDNYTINQGTVRADNRVLIFRDSAPPSGSFVTAGVKPGQVLFISAGIPEAPFQFQIIDVKATELTISYSVPFSLATDEISGTHTFSYSIGDNGPAFDNVILVASTTTANTSRTFSVANAVIMPGTAIYKIKKVELTSANSALDPFRDPVSGTILFKERANAVMESTPKPQDVLTFYLETQNVSEGQSNRSINILHVGWPAIDLTGDSLQVTYDTEVDFSAISTYVSDQQNRPLASNTIAKAFHPIYVFGSIPYKLRTAATSALDEQGAEAYLTNFINTYQLDDTLDQSLLATQARAYSGSIGAIYPFAVEYDLLAPNGKIYHFSTNDRVTIFPTSADSVTLLNPTEVGLPATGYLPGLIKQLTELGLSDKNTRYICDSGTLSFERVN